jgi:hypothetical protein
MKVSRRLAWNINNTIKPKETDKASLTDTSFRSSNMESFFIDHFDDLLGPDAISRFDSSIDTARRRKRKTKNDVSGRSRANVGGEQSDPEEMDEGSDPKSSEKKKDKQVSLKLFKRA